VRIAAILIVTVAAAACATREASPPRPSILLVTLDTTRADAIGAHTPSFNAIAARGQRFDQAYATAPETLPSHSSMLTGLYPAGHGIHENGRTLSAHPTAAQRLKDSGYRTAAFVSSFILARRFGLARGFDDYDDQLTGVERSARDTTDRAVAWLQGTAAQPVFVWVHYFDPHTPYAPPEPYRTRFADKLYAGEVAAMDEQLGRLALAFEEHAPRPHAFIVVADHGEGLGDHGERQHGNLLYQSTMRVPLAIVGPGVTPGVNAATVSTRRVFHTLLDLAGVASDNSLRDARATEVVAGEALKPFLGYGWQPQIMAVAGQQKAISAGRLEVYDLSADPTETKNLGSGANLRPGVQKVLDEYPIPTPGAVSAPETLSEDAKRNLASLGYIGATATPVVRNDAPRPADMTHLFEPLERASALFVQERYADAIPLLERILAADRFNLDAALRLATAHSTLGHEAQAMGAFRKASAIAPRSTDVRLYVALHQARGKDWAQAAPVLEQIVADGPDRLPAVEGLATVRERQGRFADAVALRQKVYALRPPAAADLVHLGELAMQAEQTTTAIEAFEQARRLQGSAFAHDLDLGALYLASRRFEDARAALDRVPPAHPDYAMVLFKRAQVSVLLNEPDRAQRIAAARARADATTRPLIARERLFQR
jgi:choline-sulfatase